MGDLKRAPAEEDPRSVDFQLTLTLKPQNHQKFKILMSNEEHVIN